MSFGLAMVLLARVSRGLGTVDRFGGVIASVVEYIIYIFRTLNILYLNFYNNSFRVCYFIKVKILRFYMGKGCARGGTVREVAQTSKSTPGI